MRNKDDFKDKYDKLKKQFETKGNLLIPGGRNGYLITNVEDQFVTIKQGKTFQKHKINHLQSLFTIGYFYGPRNNLKYNADYRKGHLLMKHAIIEYLKNVN